MALFSRKKPDQPQQQQQQQQQQDIGQIVANAVNQAMVMNAATQRGHGRGGISGTYDNADTLHDIYADYGYPDTLEFSNFWNMYRRFGIATNVVNLPVDIGWSSVPEVKATTQFISDFEKLLKTVPFWTRLKGLDQRQRVGRYGGLLMRVKDGKLLSEPLEGKQNGPASLMDMIPLYESQLHVSDTNKDATSEDYGQPTMYEYYSSVAGNRNENNTESTKIHPSRVVIASEGADDGTIYGIPALECVYNSLMDLRKIIGGGGEGFYKNASQSVIFKLMDLAGASNNTDLLTKFEENFDDFQRNRQRRGLWTPGMDAEVLDAVLANPKEYFQSALNDVAAGSKIAATILTGQQTGRLASDEDSANTLAVIQSRRMNFMSDMTMDTFLWLIKWGILPASDIELEWDDLLARSDEDKLKNAESMAGINEKQFKSGGSVPFTGEEIREAAGYEAEEEGEPEGEELDDAEED